MVVLGINYGYLSTPNGHRNTPFTFIAYYTKAPYSLNTFLNSQSVNEDRGSGSGD